MFDNDKKIEKAFDLCHKGDYDSSLDICRKILKREPQNEDMLSLAAYILHLKGNLKEAQEFWKANVSINNNMDSRKYLANIDKYLELNTLFLDAMNDVKNRKFDTAIDKLLACSQHEFNKIYSGEVLEKCVLHKNGVPLPKDYFETVLEDYLNSSNISISKYSAVARLRNQIAPKTVTNIIAESKPTKVNIKTISNNPVFKIALALCTVFIVTISYISLKNSDFTTLALKNNSSTIVEDDNSNIDSNKASSEVEKEEDVDVKETTTEEKNSLTVVDSILPKGEFVSALSQKDYSKLHSLISSIDKSKLNENDLKIFNEGFKYMKNEGVTSLYKDGSSKFGNTDYEGAITEFTKAFDFAEGHYLESHIIFMLAKSNQLLDNVDEAIKYFDMYIDKFEGDNYTPESLYILVTLCKDSKPELAKKYAKKIREDYSNSIYYNTITKAILKN